MVGDWQSSAFERAEKLRAEWAAKAYRMTVTDCISFTQEVGRSVGIKVPGRSRIILPVDYIRKVAEAN